MPSQSPKLAPIEQQLLVAFGERIRIARQRRKLGVTEVSTRAGVCRATLYNAESGDGSVTLGTYLRVLAALGLEADLQLVAANDSVGRQLQDYDSQPRPRSIKVGSHGQQDVQSLLMHREAVRMVRLDPSLAMKALATLDRWMARGDSGTLPLWREWRQIIESANWDVALRDDERGKQLRQASPMATLLPNEVRLRIIDDVKSATRRAHATH